MKIINHRLVHDDGTPYPFVASPNTRGTVVPRWLVMHATAAASAREAIAWYASKESNASAHVVIDKQGAITQLVPFDRQAWHAGNSRWEGVTGLNGQSIAIELDNRGVLSGGPGEWYFQRQPVPDSDVLTAAHRNYPDVVRGWDRFPPEQIRAAQELAALLVRTYRSEDVLGHEDISPGRKQDPGPAFPMEEFRRSLGITRPAEESPFTFTSARPPGAGPAAKAAEVTPDATLLFVVTVDALKVREGPGINHPRVDGSPLRGGTTVEVLESAGAWRRVAERRSDGVSGVTGWVSAKFLESAATTGAGPADSAAPESQAPAEEGEVSQSAESPDSGESAEFAAPEPPLLVGDAAVPGLVHDHVGTGLLKLEHDRLDIAPEVKALCHVLVAENSRPPISVGLFGDWGTGKSFFMELMHGYIRTLTGKSKDAVDKGGESAFCTDVVQIRFNAWHYMDSNLWASLAARIFDGLSAHVAAVEPDKRTELALRLAESEGVLAQMRVQRTAAEEEARRRREEFRVLNQQRRAARRRLGRSVGDALVAGVRNAARDPAFQRRLRDAESQMRLPANTLTAGSVEQKRDELRTFAGRLSEVWKGLGSGRRLVLLASALLPVAVGVVVGMKWDAISRGAGAVMGAVAGIAAVGPQVAPWLARMKRAFLSLEQANQAIERQTAIEEQKLRDAEISDQREVRRLEGEARAALHAEGDAKKAVELIRTEMEELRSGRQLQRFLQERGSADDYRRHLGIVSLIRNDFERLSELLRGLENDGPQPGMPKVDRIILYIDDLDRCPESRVVEVLQAVHLLLAFPLFVVVVGVDSRWLLLSLEDHYTALRGRTRGKDGRSRRLSTPQNYLEKIFQIPFTLRPMQPDGFGGLMRSLVTVRAVPEQRVVPSPTIQVSGSDVAALNVVLKSQPDGEIPVGRTGDEFDDAGHHAEEDAARGGNESGGDGGIEIDLTPPALELEPWEVKFMGALHPLIGSPRSAKRFVNVYQFIRARLSGDALDRFRGTADGGQYQVAGLLLACLSGFPRESRPLFAQLLAPGDAAREWWALVDEETAVPDPAAEGAEERTRFAGALQAVRAACTFADDAALVREWAPTIARFSFTRTHSGGDE